MSILPFPTTRPGPGDPDGLLEFLSVDALSVVDDSIAVALTFPDGVVRAIFTAFPSHAVHPIEVRLSWTRASGAFISGGPLMHADEAALLSYVILLDLAHRFARFLHNTPLATQQYIRGFADWLVPQGD